MDAPGTEARKQFNRSALLFVVAVGLLLVSLLMVVNIGKKNLDASQWAVSLGLWVTTPASAIVWILSFQAIRRRPVLAVISVAAAYIFGLALFVALLVNFGGIEP